MITNPLNFLVRFSDADMMFKFMLQSNQSLVEFKIN